jgi:hypothetical protein
MAESPSTSNNSSVRNAGAQVTKGSSWPMRVLRALGSFTFDILAGSFRLLHWPLSCLVAVQIMGYVIGNLTGHFWTTRSIANSIQSTICIIPGVSILPFCTIPYVLDDPDSPVHSRRSPTRTTPLWADFSKLADIQVNAFEHILDMGTSSLSLDVKKAEMATSDLTTLVKVSDLKCRDFLAAHLSHFVRKAKSSGRGLQKLNAKVNGAVEL